MMLFLGIFGLGAFIILIFSFLGSVLFIGQNMVMESRVKTMEREEALNPTPKSELQLLTEAANNLFTEIGNFQSTMNYHSSNLRK